MQKKTAKKAPVKKTTNTLVQDYTKQFGPAALSLGVSYYDDGRIPTGIFPFDLSSAGGFPKGRVSVVYGQESSMKTTVALCAIREAQAAGMTAAFVDAENSLDPSWAKSIGVDVDSLLYAVPEYAEQAIDMTIGLLEAEDIDLVVLDSIAALVSTQEIQKSAEEFTPGVSGRNAGVLYRKATAALARQRREERFPALICINQIRYKIGVLMGNPETQPGGQAFKFASAMTVRVRGVDVMEEKVHPSMPYAKTVVGVIQKHKVPINARGFEFVMPNMNLPEHGIVKGQVDAWKTIKALASKLGLLEQTKAGWQFMGEDLYKTQNEYRVRLRTDPAYRKAVEGRLVDEVYKRLGEKSGAE